MQETKLLPTVNNAKQMAVLLVGVPIGLLVSLGFAVLLLDWIIVFSGIKNPHLGILISRETSIPAMVNSPEWIDSVPSELLTNWGKYLEPTEQLDRKIWLVDHWFEKEMHLRTVLLNAPTASPQYWVEIKTQSEDWRILDHLVNLNAQHPQLFEDPDYGICVAYTVPQGPAQGEVWALPLNGDQPHLIIEGLNLTFAPDRSTAVFLAQYYGSRDVTINSVRHSFILWDIANKELKQITTATTNQWRSGLNYPTVWSADSKFLRLAGNAEMIYSVEHDELYELPSTGN